MDGVPEGYGGWTFLTNHARVLASIDDDPGTRIRDIAARCRLTERAVQKIISDLEQSGYLTHTRQGRSNLYRIEQGTILRHPADLKPHRGGPAGRPRPARELPPNPARTV